MFTTLLENGNYSRTLRQWDPVKGNWQEVTQTKQALQQGDQVIALVNNLGATPLSELYGVYNRLETLCDDAGITCPQSGRFLVYRWICPVFLLRC
jgi:dihydroxyacetone kinase-like protein